MAVITISTEPVITAPRYPTPVQSLRTDGASGRASVATVLATVPPVRCSRRSARDRGLCCEGVEVLFLGVLPDLLLNVGRRLGVHAPDQTMRLRRPTTKVQQRRGGEGLRRAKVGTQVTGEVLHGL